MAPGNTSSQSNAPEPVLPTPSPPLVPTSPEDERVSGDRKRKTGMLIAAFHQHFLDGVQFKLKIEISY